MTLADAHVHFFPRGYHRDGLSSLLGTHEVETYEALRRTYGIEAALAVGYEADGYDPANNATIRELAATRPWLTTLAYMEPGARPTAATLGALMDGGHAGLSLYVLEPPRVEALLKWPRDCWELLHDRRAIISFNARPHAAALLRPVIEAYPGISCLFSHLGLPGKGAPIEARLGPLLALAELPNVFVKISGLYATSEPEHAYPHDGAAAAIAKIIATFGVSRCLWASDFAPVLDFVSFPQAIEWPGMANFSAEDRQRIQRDNLLRLLGSAGILPASR